MKMMRRWTFLALAIVVFLLYIIIQSRAFLFPPALVVEGKQVVNMKTGQEFIVSGQVKRAGLLKINGEQIPLTPKGAFSQPLLVKPGITVIEVVATSRFGKEARKTITLIGRE